MIFGLFGKRPDRLGPVKAMFARVAEASRQPVFYRDAGIPDTFEGRFESLTLHVYLVMRRLRALPAPAAELAQDFVDSCFAYLELGFRNGGISDVTIPKRMKKIAQSFYGRVDAYEAGFAAQDPAVLVDALRRNASPEGAPALAAYMRQADAALSVHDLDAILREEILFPVLDTDDIRHDA